MNISASCYAFLLAPFSCRLGAPVTPTPMSDSPLTGGEYRAYPISPDPKARPQFTPEERMRCVISVAKAGQAGPSSDPTVAARRQAEMQLLEKRGKRSEGSGEIVVDTSVIWWSRSS